MKKFLLSLLVCFGLMICVNQREAFAGMAPDRITLKSNTNRSLPEHNCYITTTADIYSDTKTIALVGSKDYFTLSFGYDLVISSRNVRMNLSGGVQFTTTGKATSIFGLNATWSFVTKHYY